MSKTLRIGWLALLALAMAGVSGCGFKLRGAEELPPAMAFTFIQGKQNSELVRELRHGLETAGARVTEQRAEASAVLRVIKEQFDRRVLSVGGNAKVAEYELNYQVRFDLQDPQGKVLMKEQTVNLVRDYFNDETQVIGKADEEALIREEMRRDLVSLMFFRMRAQMS